MGQASKKNRKQTVHDNSQFYCLRFINLTTLVQSTFDKIIEHLADKYTVIKKLDPFSFEHNFGKYFNTFTNSFTVADRN